MFYANIPFFLTLFVLEVSRAIIELLADEKFK